MQHICMSHIPRPQNKIIFDGAYCKNVKGDKNQTLVLCMYYDIQHVEQRSHREKNKQKHMPSCIVQLPSFKFFFLYLFPHCKYATKRT